MAEGKKRVATIRGIPYEKIKDAQTVWPEVVVKLARRVSGGKLTALGTEMMTLDQLATVDEWIKERAGGGTFRVEPRNPANILEYADTIPPFELDIEGRPKPATPNEHGVQGIPGGIAAAGGPVTMQWPNNPPGTLPNPALPPWAQKLPPQYQQAFAAAQNPNGVLAGMGERQQVQAPTQAFASDFLAHQQTQYTRDELTKERTERENERKQWEARIEQLVKASEEAKDEARQAREKAERDKFEAKMEALQSKPSIDPQVWIGLAGALAPVLTAFITSSKDRANAQAEQANKAVELQMASVNSLLSAGSKKGSDLEGLLGTVATLAPVLGPILGEHFKSKSPQAQADLFATLAESNLTTLSTMGNFLQSVMEMQNGDPWWRPMLESGIDSALEVANHYAAVVGGQNAPQEGATSGAPPQGPPKAAGGVTKGMAMATMIINSSGFPPDFKTGAWVQAIAALHEPDKNIPAEAIAQHIAQHCVNLHNQDALPKLIENVMEDPQGALMTLLEPLPVFTRDKEWATSVVEQTVALLQQAQPVEAQGEVVEATPEEAAVEGVPFHVPASEKVPQPA